MIIESRMLVNGDDPVLGGSQAAQVLIMAEIIPS